VEARQAQDMDISPGDSTPTSEPLTSCAHDPLPQGPVLLATGTFFPDHFPTKYQFYINLNCDNFVLFLSITSVNITSTVNDITGGWKT
jgi:hypothetical protein